MRSLKVLIAESDRLLQKLYSDIVINDSSLTLTKCVSTGSQMFDAMRCVCVDLVLLDLFMDDFNAVRDLDELRKLFPHTDFIVLSSGERPEIVRKALCAGVFDFLVKPFSFDRLRATLRNYQIYYHSLTDRTKPWQQDDLDALLAMKGRDSLLSDDYSVPKGIQLKCLNEVEGFLKSRRDSFSAQEVGNELGISRSTARRYLEFLTTSERVVVEYAYRKIGRPEKRYRIPTI
ncbi:MAG: response regulator [Synergistes sp.]|nr:response regulator [Synergistes sp.]